MTLEQHQILHIQQLVSTWLEIDVNPTTRSQISELYDYFIKNNNDSDTFNKLQELLNKRMVFGTAGLRARMEAGYNRMNDVTVLQASQGLAAYIKSINQNNELTVVIGHDHRFNSKRFAELAIVAFLTKGFKVYYIGDQNCATPMVPFAIDKFSLLCGIMITASHNPKDDNGYKVYWSNGCQIIPPTDSNIQASILNNLDPQINKAWDTKKYMEDAASSSSSSPSKLIYCYDEVIKSYNDHLLKVLNPNKLNADFKFVYTPMHGVGFKFVNQLIKSFTPNVEENFHFVKEQIDSDPAFPTVKFPNPEEKGALDLAIKTADELNISLIVANDPDADRFTAAFKSNDKWVQLSGNELGILFTDYVINQCISNGDDLSKIYILNSTVSSQMIKSIANSEGFNFKDTLTGFKWIGNKAIELELSSYTVPFAYEEAIGFMFPTVHDKDGISALVVFLQLYNKLINDGLNAIEKLEQLYAKYGYFKQCNGYYITPKPEIMNDIFNNIIRKKNWNSKLNYPSNLGVYKVTYWRDLTIGFQSDTIDGKPELYIDPNSQMITCKLTTENENEIIQFTARGSGTEPKLKVYIEAKAGDEKRSQFLANDVWKTLRDEWFCPTQHGLVEKLV